MGDLFATHGPRIAVFIDADNLLIAARDSGLYTPVRHVMRAARSLGTITAAWAYGDWSQGLCRSSLEEFRGNVVQLAQLATGYYGKNSADIAIAVDAVEMICSEQKPDVLTLVSGDRDFVPLVLKARRYGLAVLGIGVRGSVGAELVSACDRFLYLDDLVPPEQASDEVEQGEAVTAAAETAASPPDALDPPPAAPAAPVPLDRPRLLVAVANAVEAVLARGDQAYGARVISQLRDTVGDFDVADFGFSSFREVVEAAQAQGLVTAQFSSYTDMVLDLPDRTEQPESVHYSFATSAEAVQSYLTILAKEKGVPLIAWPFRRALVEALWQDLGAAPATLSQMNRFLTETNHRDAFGLSERACLKVTHTLNIAHCFSDGERADYFQDMHWVALRPAVDLDTALYAMHEVYLRGICMAYPDAPLWPEAVAELLFGDAAEDYKEQAEQLVQLIRPNRNDTIGERFGALRDRFR